VLLIHERPDRFGLDLQTRQSSGCGMKWPLVGLMTESSRQNVPQSEEAVGARPQQLVIGGRIDRETPEIRRSGAMPYVDR
jgi:hypothetical protein